MGSQQSLQEQQDNQITSNKPKENSFMFQDKHESNHLDSNYKETTFIWNTKADRVCLVGQFQDWKVQNEMIRLKEDCFQLNLQLQPGYYEYKYVVDGLWKHSEEQQQVIDNDGNINNYVRVTNDKQHSVYSVYDYDDYYMNLCGDNQHLIQTQNPKVTHHYQQQDLINIKHNSFDDIDIKDTNIEEQSSIIENGFFDPKGPEDCPKHLLSIYFIQQNETNQQEKHSKIENQNQNENELTTSQPKELKKPHHVTINHFGLKDKQHTSEFNVSVITQRIRSKYTTYKFYSKKYFSNY